MSSEYITSVLSKENIESYALNHTEYYSCVGYYKKAAEHSVVRKKQDFYLLMLCADGCGTLCSDGNAFEIQKGDCMVCYAGTSVAYTSSKEHPWSLYWIHFDIQSKSPLLPLLYNEDVSPQKPVVNIQNGLALIELFEKIIKFNDAPSDELQFYLHQNVFLTLLYTGLAYYKTPDRVNRYITEAIQYIENNLNKKITLNELAEHVHLSKYYFSHLFQESMQVSPSRYITERRIQYAKTLMASSSLSIREIAEKSGFDNAMYFSNVFKKHEGISPKSFNSLRI